MENGQYIQCEDIWRGRDTDNESMTGYIYWEFRERINLCGQRVWSEYLRGRSARWCTKKSNPEHWGRS